MTRATVKNKVSIDLRVDEAAWEPKIRTLRPKLSRAVTAALAAQKKLKVGACDVSVILTDDRRIRTLNRKHRGKDKATNVLSFPLMDSPTVPNEPTYLGDIVLAFETIDREAKEAGKPFAAHFIHLAVHGTLHLCGYDHVTEGQARTMERLEKETLAILGLPDPYAHD